MTTDQPTIIAGINAAGGSFVSVRRGGKTTSSASWYDRPDRIDEVVDDYAAMYQVPADRIVYLAVRLPIIGAI
jgi:hypothetical protein